MPFGFEPNSLLIFIVLIAGVAGKYITSHKRKTRSVRSPNTSVLLSYYSEGAELTKIQSAKLQDGLRYSVLLAANRDDVPGNPSHSVIYKIMLPFASTIHLLGIPKKTNAIRLNPAMWGGVMERVTLEGNYDNVFDLFCEKGMQTDTRYVLDPKAMVFTLDFCQSQNWEIVGNELYFVISSEMRPDPKDKTGVLEDVVTFIEEIRPAVERPLTPSELKHLSPYGKDYRTNLRCPLCSKTMVNEEIYYHCPDNHGVLLSGGQLQQLVNGALKPKMTSNNPMQHTHELHCPSCSSPMAQVAYSGGSMVIDSCTKCAYRWLDAGEYTK